MENSFLPPHLEEILFPPLIFEPKISGLPDCDGWIVSDHSFTPPPTFFCAKLGGLENFLGKNCKGVLLILERKGFKNGCLKLECYTCIF